MPVVVVLILRSRRSYKVTWFTVRVIVVLPPLRLGLTVSLAQTTGSLHGAAAALLLVVSAPAPLACRLLQGQGGVLTSLS